MGVQQTQSNLFSYRVNLEQRIRADHPLRRVDALLDLGWVREDVAQCYGANGNVSVDPVVLVKMMLLLFLDNVPSERELMSIIRERLDYMWFLGYTLDDDIPNHSVLSKARTRWGSELFEKIFVRTVVMCVEAGLVSNHRLHVDSSVIKASASKDSVVSASPELVAAVRNAYAAEEQKLEERSPSAVNATHISKTDPQATLARSTANAASQLSYKSHRAVDDANGVITSVLTTTGDAADGQQLPPLLMQHAQTIGARPKLIVGDQHYGTAENYRHCQSLDVRTHLKPSRAHQPKGAITVEQFEYEGAYDRFRCPAGNYLYYHNFKRSEGLVEYRIENRKLCHACPLRSACTSSRAGRSITRPLLAELVQHGRNEAQTKEAHFSYRRRKHVIEGSFADATNNHGFKRSRWRGLVKQQIQDWMIAAVQNLRIMARNRKNGWHMAVFASVLRHLRLLRHLLSLLLAPHRVFKAALHSLFTARSQ